MIVAARFNGPPTSGNGGYTAGLFATEAGAGGPMTVTLRQPPPLETPLTITPGGELLDGDRLIATIQAEPVQPTAPDWGDPTEAAAYAGFTDHPFPTCYVCGPAKSDGLRIFPGRLPDGRTAANWTIPDQAGRETVWAALDCPGGWAIIAPGRPYVLGRITVAIDALPNPGDDCVIVGECTGVEGRKGFVRTGLFGPDRRLLAAASATWITV
ncbi:MAG: hypothetical protein HOU81_24870 [Hamadaea sp.]|uniref:hypothetical protein n=1 Tax=Hamadaea sp. TaxID=2024425 RepID=UPI0017D87D8F|nr:hypothetical protein [Hamadaea sp.]NUR74058.1 hypothetical protein [Hamadaea sp.]NUT22655.1 hypothetical protein [Hamadaea sp.]